MERTNNIIEFLKNKRIELGMSQNKLALAIGKTQPFMAEIENGRKSPSFDVLLKMCAALKLKFCLSDIQDDIINTDDEIDVVNFYRALDDTEKESIYLILKKMNSMNYVHDPKIIKKKSKQNRTIKIIGKVAAGLPIEAFENVIGEVVRTEDIPSSADFGLQISGDSMEPLIHNGSIVWIKKQSIAESGQIIIAIRNNEVTCKRLYYNNGQAILHSENDNYKDIIINNFEFEIHGIVLNYK